MSIKGELTKTASYLQSARKAILFRGGEISPTAGLKDLPDAIYKIPADASLAYQVDDGVAYSKIVPVGAKKFAQVNKIGGRTYYDSNNLLTYPYFHTTKNHKGIKFTDNGDGSITINGMNDGTGMSSFYLFHIDNKPLHLKAGTYTIFDTGNSNIVVAITDKNGTYYKGTFLLSADTDVQVIIRIPTGSKIIFDNFTIYPMLNKGSTAFPWEKYWATKDAKATALRSRGESLINPAEYIPKFANYKSLSIEASNDGTLFINGELNNLTIDADKALKLELEAGAYTLSLEEVKGKGRSDVRVFRSGGYTAEYLIGTATADEPILTFEWTDEDIEQYGSLEVVLALYGPMSDASDHSFYPFKDYTLYLRLIKGTTSLNCEIPIHEAIQAIEGYGQSNPNNPDEYNYIDFDRRLFVAYGHIVDGAWVAYSEPIETDISEYLTDKFIEVVGGGTITAVNERIYDVPSTITYLIETTGE